MSEGHAANMSDLEHQLYHNYEAAQKARDEYMAQARKLQQEIAEKQRALRDAELRIAEYQGALNIAGATLKHAEQARQVPAEETINADFSDAG